MFVIGKARCTIVKCTMGLCIHGRRWWNRLLPRLEWCSIEGSPPSWWWRTSTCGSDTEISRVCLCTPPERTRRVPPTTSGKAASGRTENMPVIAFVSIHFTFTAQLSSRPVDINTCHQTSQMKYTPGGYFKALALFRCRPQLKV